MNARKKKRLLKIAFFELEFHSYLNSFIFSIDLARFGTANFGTGVSRINRNLKFFETCFNNVNDDILYEKINEIVKFEDLNIFDVFEFLNSQEDFKDEVSKTSLIRAVNCLSKLYSREEKNELFWAIAGLESIYTMGNEGLTSQLVEKCTVFLNLENDISANIKEMYRFRSKFIHGKQDIPNIFYEADIGSKIEKFRKEEFFNTLLAVSLLIASIQKMIKLKRTELKFKYILLD